MKTVHALFAALAALLSAPALAQDTVHAPVVVQPDQGRLRVQGDALVGQFGATLLPCELWMSLQLIYHTGTPELVFVCGDRHAPRVMITRPTGETLFDSGPPPPNGVDLDLGLLPALGGDPVLVLQYANSDGLAPPPYTHLLRWDYVTEEFRWLLRTDSYLVRLDGMLSGQRASLYTCSANYEWNPSQRMFRLQHASPVLRAECNAAMEYQDGP